MFVCFFSSPPFCYFLVMLQYVCHSFVLCVGAKGKGQLRKKKYHTNAFCLKMRMMKAFAFFQEVRPKSGKRHGSMTQHSMLCKCMATCRYAPRMGSRFCLHAISLHTCSMLRNCICIHACIHPLIAHTCSMLRSDAHGTVCVGYMRLHVAFHPPKVEAGRRKKPLTLFFSL